MKRRLVLETKVGIFIVIVLLLMAWISLRLGNFNLFVKRGYTVSAIFETAAGLDPESKVLLAGLRIGKIKDIRVQDGKALVVVRVNGDVSLPKDSRVKIMSQGLLGARYLDIKPGNPETGLMKEGDSFQNVEMPVEISRMAEDLTPVIENIQAITESLRLVVDTQRFRMQVDGIAGNVEDVSGELAKLLANNQVQLARVVDNMEQLTAALADNVMRNRDEIDRTLAAMPLVAENLALVAERLADLMEENGEDLSDTLANLNEASRKLADALESVDSVMAKVDEGQGTIGGLVNERETLDNLSEAAEGLNDFLGKAKRTRLDFEYNAQYLFDADYYKHYVSAYLWPRPNHYFMMGVVYDEDGRITTQDTRKEIVTNPGEADEEREVIEEEKETYRDTFRFSAQIALRYWDFVVRGGLIEGEGGAGLDYYLWDDRIRMSVEAFDFNDDDGLHLKTGVQARFFNNFLITGGVDDFIDKDHDPYWYVGAGLIISDSDIKSLISLLPVSQAF